MRPRVVADTNVLVSAFIADGAPRRFIRGCEMGHFGLVTSPGILYEYERVIQREKFHDAYSDLVEGLAIIANIAEIAEIRSTPRFVHDDPDDNKILAAALDGKADYIISGDSHLLDLKECQGIPIMRVSEFLALHT